MPGNRHSYRDNCLETGNIYHLTARCHDRTFLLKAAYYRQIFVNVLFECQERYGVPVLNYTVTSNHIHLLVQCPERITAIPRMMRDLKSRLGALYNKRAERKGAFWERRYHGTAVQTGSHLIRCTVYIDLNMVRAGVVSHPSQWKHGGYHEIVKPKQRYKLVDREALMWLLDMGDDPRFSKWYAEKVAQAIVDKDLDREAIWTQELAVGSLEFVERIRKRCGYTSKVPPDSPAVVYEDFEGYGATGTEGENLFEW